MTGEVRKMNVALRAGTILWKNRERDIKIEVAPSERKKKPT